MLRIIAMIVFFLFSSSMWMNAQSEQEELTIPLPEPSHSIGIAMGFSQFSLSGNFNLNTYSSKYLYDDKNDIFEVEGNSNYKISLLYNYYLDSKKLFAISGNLSYSTRQAKLTASPKYLVRDPLTLDTAYLMTTSVINTKFNALSFDISAYARFNVVDNFYLFIGGGPNFNLVLDSKNSDYTSTILGLENQDKISYRETDITYKNGLKSISFDNTEENDLGKSIEGNSLILGLHLSIGAEWFLKKDLAIRLEATAQGDFSNYFKNQSLGMTSLINLSIGVLYSGIFY